jgi:diguanylate cyclase (GGDEF)-like protein/PAS domain S-box-containing protein
MQRLSINEERFRNLYTQTPAMLHSIDAKGRILSVSQLWLDTLGYREEQVVGRPLADFLTPDSARYAVEVVFPQSKVDGRCDNVAYQMVAKDGSILDVLLSSVWERDAKGDLLRTSAALLDVTEKNRLAARSHFAEHDVLTGLPNRVLLQDRLERACAHHARQGGSFAVGFLDLDHFKAVNDLHGHEAGDLLLCEVARRLQAALRESDTVCRLGGDEFVLLFTETGLAEDLHKIAAEIFAQVARPCKLGDQPNAPTVDVAVSLGVAVFPEHGRDPQTLLQRADQAMYTAKRGGRNRYEFFRL